MGRLRSKLALCEEILGLAFHLRGVGGMLGNARRRRMKKVQKNTKDAKMKKPKRLTARDLKKIVGGKVGTYPTKR